MPDEKFQNKYRIKSARAYWHDYGGGAYFITVCTKDHKHFFGKIDNAVIQLSPMGQFLYENIQNVTSHYPYAEIQLFVVMPNHWHAIVFIDENKIPYMRGNVTTCNIVETGRAPSLQYHLSINEKMQRIDSFKGWLSVTIGGIKSSVTQFAHKNNIDFTWQTRFHDRIIRNQNEFDRITDYIENNPARWHTDCFNKK